MSNIAFRPVRGKESSILAMEISEGCAYFATDTGKIYIDTATERIPMGGSGAAIYYGLAADLKENEVTSFYDYPTSGLEDSSVTPKIGDIILNSDGKFFRILTIEDTYFQCSLLAVSGSGSGGGSASTTTRPSLLLEALNTYNLINGQDAKVYLTATSAEVNGVVLSKDITISWQLSSKNASGVEEIYHQDQKTVESGIRNFIDFGAYLRESTVTKVTLQASALNHEAASWIQSFSVTTSNLELSHISSFSPTNIYGANDVVLSCNANGNTAKILDFYFDGQLLEHRVLAANALTTQNYTVPSSYCTHGHHNVKIELYQSLDGDYGLGVEPLEFEIPVALAGQEKPIIWLGSYQSIYYNYDSIQIPFLVYDPADTTKAVVHLYKNRIELESSPRTITNFKTFSYWEIADADLEQLNYYQISCGEDEKLKVEREIVFTVEKDPNRDMTVVKQENLQLNFDPAGRSNSESASNREKWFYNNITATFEDFNWYNNGWMLDEDISQTCLRISNGAKFTIPFGVLDYGTSTASKQSNTIEIQCKIKNIQSYNNLITNITRYSIGKIDEGGYYDEEIYQDFLNQDSYDNYDAYLQATLPSEDYEKLEYWKVQKNIDLSNVAVGFYDEKGENQVVGVCVGPQDTFFSNGTNTVNVSFVEEEMVNLSFVYSHSLKLLFIYINGCITGVIHSDANEFSISSGNIVFDSSACDIDLYKLRIYNTDLNVNDIVVNFAVDRKDVKVYDQNNLAIENKALKEYQLQFDGDAGILAYNESHPTAPLMPYIIYDTSDFDDNRLPWSKKITRNIKVEFVNTPLDRAYANGELEELARKDGLIAESETDSKKIKEAVELYYKHHCPSWTSTLKADDRVEIVVQGTSSEFYPRRNFKIKTKLKDVKVWDDEEENADGTVGAFVEDDVLNIYMNKGPFADIYAEDAKKVLEDKTYYGHEKCRMTDGWYLNNYTNATDRWTMKVDYMESSGSYNAGFASLIGNSYTKHPLKDYIDKGAVKDDDNQLEPVVDALSGEIRWEDYRTSLLGFPVMAFQKKADGSYLFIGYYRMLLDKGSDEVLGFKPGKKVVSTLFKDTEGKDKQMRDVAECWEFATNSRTFCSFRDPWNRVKFSFKAPVGATNEFTADMAPVVMNHFEYRYHWAEDYLDAFIEYKALSQDKLNELIANLRKDTGNNNIPDLIAYSDDEDGKINARIAADVTLDFHKNWEDVCAWVWSTNLDNVASQGEYKLANVGKVIYEPNKYYILVDSDYIIDTSATYTEGVTYFNAVEDKVLGITYVNAYVADSKYVYQPNTFYQNIAGTYSLISDKEFNDSIDYYEFTSKSDEELATLADLLVTPADISKGFDSATQYYLYDGNVTVDATKASGAVIPVTNPTASEFNSGIYYVAHPVSYAGKTYKYDTKEYRSAKFINELTSHFDPEYLATYFVATEVFECYDSRGKNCMMASWGPHTDGGNYIWYPIFYDIDTQLGINNTGIPSFEFNVDATDEGNFSTSDSILWNNFYKFFKSSYILTKYQNMRGTDTSAWDKLKNPPLESVDYLEKWYSFDPNTTNNIACRGDRPLIATNLDMYFKYITITNDNAIAQGVGYLLGEQGVMSIDPGKGTYFYALQGDRSQSRRQFLTNRLEYIDSWLNQGNYARAGNNRIRGRISANNINGGTHSDIWVETAEDPYWKDKEFGTKSHEFDSQYWLDLTPIRSSYVTAGDDSANYPSEKYDGINTAKFRLSELEQGIRQSANYPEQLLYIYGMNQMKDVGDMSKLYWTEFYLEGEAPKLTRLKLGHDGYSLTDGGRWYNKKLNGITLPKLPLLKEANFCNIGLSNETTLDLTASEKLENFRATGTSKLVSVKFADGVALNTLYLPESVTELSLTQANLLTDLITNYEAPTTNPITGELTATPGLFLEGFFGDSFSSQISTIELNGGALGYNSYTLLDRFYKSKINSTGTKIAITNVNWCPFTALAEGDTYDSNYAYFKNDGHYGFEWYNVNPSNYDSQIFNTAILNGELYKAGPYVQATTDESFNTRYIYFEKIAENTYTLLEDFDSDDYATKVAIGNIYYINKGSVVIDDSCYSMLIDLYENTKTFTGISSTVRPTISGIIYIENENAIEESEIRNKIQNYYPEITFFFKTVTKAYSAKFVLINPDNGTYSYVKFKDGTTSIPSVQKIKASEVTFDDNGKSNVKFASPFENYSPVKTHYDFLGWSLTPTPGKDDEILATPGEGENDPWLTSDMGLIKQDENGNPIYDYTYYAIFVIHEYVLTFYNHDGVEIVDRIKVPYGNKAKAPTAIPYKDDSQLEGYASYDFQGWSLASNGNIVDVTSILVSGDEEFYAIFKQIDDIRSIVHKEYFTFTDKLYTVDATPYGGDTYTGYAITGLNVSLKGKIVIPKSYNGYPVISIGENFANSNNLTQFITHVFIETLEDGEAKPIYEIHNSAFANLSTLKYFDFEHTDVKMIGNNAFQKTSLDSETFNLSKTHVLWINGSAFNQGIQANGGKLNLVLPSSLVSMEAGVFRYLQNCSSVDITIGSESELSALNLSIGNGPTIKFDQNVPTNVTFYSALYDDSSDPIGDDSSITVYECFGKNLVDCTVI